VITLHEKPWLKRNETLVCVGDSLTAPKDGYVALLAKALKPLKIRVINAGLGGDKTPQTLSRLRQDVIARKPDAVSIFLGTNDGVIGRGRWADEPRVSPEAYRCNLVWIMYLCRQKGIRKFSITPPMFYEGGLWTDFGEPFSLYRIAAREAADEMGARLVPADVAFQQEWQKHPGHTGLLLTDDGAHLNAAGHRLVAEASLRAGRMA